jgi:TRL-like protein family
MGKKKIFHLVLSSSLLIIMVSLTNCSGLNVLTRGLGWGATTNPTPDYANGIHLYKGGLFYHRHTVPGTIGLNADGSLKGESCSHSALYLISWGDSGIETAKKKSGITKVSSVEYEQMGILGTVYHRFCTIVIGNSDAANPNLPVTDSKTEVKTPAKKGK